MRPASPRTAGKIAVRFLATVPAQPEVRALMENRNALIVGAVATRASSHAERLAAPHQIGPYADRPNPVTFGADQGFDARTFAAELREINVTPHLAQNTCGRRSAIDRQTTRHAGYAVSQRIRKPTPRPAQDRLAVHPDDGRL